MRTLFVLCALAAVPALAQEQRPTDTEINARVQAYADLDGAAQSVIKQQAAAKIGAMADAIDKLQKELAAAKKQCPAPEKK